jgi:hypothetical protein
MKVNRKSIAAILATILAVGCGASLIYERGQQGRFLQGFDIALFLLFFLLIPLVWVERLRRNQLLNQTYLASLTVLMLVGAWHEIGNKPSSYLLGLMGVGVLYVCYLEVRDWMRGRNPEVSADPAELGARQDNLAGKSVR